MTVSKRPLPKPVWWKNTYFLISALLLIISMVGVAFGSHTIRDPGQRPESNLSLIYLLASVVMLVNGLISHRQTVMSYEEMEESAEESKD